MLNTNNDDHFYPIGDPISGDELSFDSYVGNPPSESKVYEYVYPPPSVAPNTAPEVVTPPTTSPIGYINQEVSATTIQSQPYQRNKWTKSMR